MVTIADRALHDPVAGYTNSNDGKEYFLTYHSHNSGHSEEFLEI
jgi:hypothetical protein